MLSVTPNYSLVTSANRLDQSVLSPFTWHRADELSSCV